MYKIKLQNFEGPLDLLLQLIESADLDITQVALADVTDQFVEYLEKIEEKKPDILADFLVVASKLLLIKSKVLLPSLEIDSEENIDDLETQLKIYKEYYQASKVLAGILAQKKVLFSRKKIPLEIKTVFNPPKNLKATQLKQVFLTILKQIEPIIKLPKKSLLKAISIKEKISHIRQQILQKIKTNFSELVSGSKNKTEVVVTFLSLLELIKQKDIKAKQNKMFGEINIEKL